MKKGKIIIAVFLGFVLGALCAIGVYFLTVGEVAWKEYIESKLVPNAVLALTAICGLATALLPIIAKTQVAIDKFNKATKDVNDTVENGRKTECALNDQEKRISENYATLSEKISLIEKDTKKTREMCKIAFCNISELVKSGYAAEIARAEEKNEE